MHSSAYRFRGLFFKEPGFVGRTPARSFDVPWTNDAIGDLFPERLEENKNLTPMWAALALKPGTTRGEDNITELYAVVLDKDCGDTGELEAVTQHLKTNKYAALVYTAHSHRSKTKTHEDTGLPGPFDSFRVVLPLSRAVSPAEYRSLVAAVYQTGVVPPDLEKYRYEVAGRTVTLPSGETRPARARGWDPAAYRPAQPWYIPCASPATVNEAGLDVLEGRVLDVDWLLSLKAAPITQRRLYADSPASAEAKAKFAKVYTALEQAGFPLGDDDPETNCRGICPSCQDPSPSLLVRAKGERVLMNCFAGCDLKSLLKATGLTHTDLFTTVATEAWKAEQDAKQPNGALLDLEGVTAKTRRSRPVEASASDGDAVVQPSTHAADELARAIQRAFGTDRAEPYTREELQAMMPIEKRWILVTPAGFFLRAPSGYVQVTEKGLKVAARDMFAPAFPHVDIIDHGDGGESKPRIKSLDELLNQYGQYPTHTAYSYCVARSELNGDTFVQRAGIARDFEPEYNPQIAQWLLLLAGTEHEALLDWLATLTRTDRPTAGLCVMGTSGAGKDLLIDGLAEIWNGSSLSFERALHRFNVTLTESPLVVANEEVRVPKDFGGSPSDALKEMISDNRRKVEAKFGATVDLHGCLRVILATNANGVLKFSRDPTPSDIVALDDRILLLRPTDECRAYLESLRGRETTEAWVAGGGIAKHVAWLQRERKVKPGPRFLVQGRGGLSDLLSADGRGSAAVLRAILEVLLGPKDRNERIAHAWNGHVYVSAPALKSAWPTYGKGELPEDWGGAADNVFEKGASVNRTVGTDQIKMRRVKWPVLLRAAQREGRLEDLLPLKRSG